MRLFLPACPALLLFAACAEPIEPADLICPDAAVIACDDAVRPRIALMTDDAANRSAATLTGGAGALLVDELVALESAISAGNITQARAALARCRQAHTAAVAELSLHPENAPDLSAIDLALIQAELALQ